MELSRRVVIDPRDVQQPWAISAAPDEVTLAGADPDLDFGQCEVYVGDRPLVLDFQRSVVEALQLRATGADAHNEQRVALVKRVRPHWRYYMLVYGVGVTNCKKLRELSFRVTYNDTKESPVTIVDLWPKSTREIAVEVDGRVSATLNMFGQFSDEIVPETSLLRTIGLPFGGTLELGGEGDLVARMSCDISWPIVESFGMASASGYWMVRRTKKRDMNQQIFCHIIYTQQDVSEIQASVTVGGVYRGFFEAPTVSESRIELSPILLHEA